MVSGTKEWASSNENLMFGCQHDCKYCYAKAMSVRHKKIDIDRWVQPILREKALNKSIGTRKGTIMFPTTHDIHPDQIDATIVFLRKLLSPGNNVLIVSKPHLECIKEICLYLYEYKDQILFRFTIGSADNSVLGFWEPGAPDFQERLAALAFAYNSGFKTSVSCEPMLDNHIIDVVDTVKEYVTDSIWIGKMNNASQRCKINGHGDMDTEYRLNQIERWQSDESIKSLYLQLKDTSKIKWKESIKKVVGIEVPTEAGLDI